MKKCRNLTLCDVNMYNDRKTGQSSVTQAQKIKTCYTIATNSHLDECEISIPVEDTSRTLHPFLIIPVVTKDITRNKQYIPPPRDLAQTKTRSPATFLEQCSLMAYSYYGPAH